MYKPTSRYVNGWEICTVKNSAERNGKARNAKALVLLAAPMTGTALVNMGMSITDTVMMGWLGPTSLAAGAVVSATALFQLARLYLRKEALLGG